MKKKKEAKMWWFAYRAREVWKIREAERIQREIMRAAVLSAKGH